MINLQIHFNYSSRFVDFSFVLHIDQILNNESCVERTHYLLVKCFSTVIDQVDIISEISKEMWSWWSLMLCIFVKTKLNPM